MAATIQLSRDTHVFIGKGTTYWKIPVLDGFSFSQATSTTEVTLNEMQEGTSGASNRGRSMFTNALEPAEWSFSTYARPTLESTKHTAVEEVLWAHFFGASTWNDTTDVWTPAAVSATRSSNMAVTSANSDLAELGTFDVYFVLGGCAPGATPATYASSAGQTIYKLSGCVVNTAGIDFDIDGITTINWSGFGTEIEQLASLDMSGASGRLGYAGSSSTSNFLRNRITSLSLRPDTDGDAVFGEATDLDQDGDATTGNAGGVTGDDFQTEYHLTLTGGSINFENNITFLTPEELCKVNTPIGHITGTRNISGSFSCYLNDDDVGVTGARSAAFFEDLAANKTMTRNKFNVKFTIGGASAPNLVVEFPGCHVDIPTHQIEDVISLETAFHALPSSITSADEVTLTYTGA